MNKKMFLVLLAGIFATLPGCGDSSAPDKAKPANQKSAKPAEQKTSKTSDSETDWHKKAKSYIQINNRILGFQTQNDWQRAAAEKAKKGNFKEVRTDTYRFDDSLIKNLKEAIAQPGALPPEVDIAGKKLLDAVEKYVPSWKQLNEYNKSKKYEDDKGAKGTELLAVYLEGIEVLKQAVKELDVQVSIVAKQSHEKALVEYKKKGLLLELHTLEALGAAENIINLFDSTDDFKDQAKIDTANAQLALMETSLEAMKTEHAKRKESDRKSLPLIDRYDSIQSELVAFAGDYREARKKPAKFNDAVSRYNKAVNERNRMN